MERIIYLSLVNASISFTVTETRLFLPVREWAKRRSVLLGELLSCGYCFGHWTALALVAVYRAGLFELWRPLDYVLSAILVAWLSAFQWAFMCWVMEKAGK